MTTQSEKLSLQVSRPDFEYRPLVAIRESCIVNGVVADGRSRIIAQHSTFLYARIAKKLAPKLATSNWFRRKLIHVRISRMVERKLKYQAPPAALYLQN